MAEAVYITGMSAITPVGSGNEGLWESVRQGRSGISTITRFDTSWLPNNIAACIEDENPFANLFEEELDSLGPATQCMLAVARQALLEAGLLTDQRKVIDRVLTAPLFISTTHGEIQAHFDKYFELLRKNDETYTFHHIQNYFNNHVTYQVLVDTARLLGLQGIQSINLNACASSGFAIGLGVNHLRQGKGQVALCGGVDVTSVAEYAGFCSLRSMAPQYCQPFDKNRQGLVIGEGSGMIVLETASSVAQRGVKPIAELKGYGWSSDAYHLSTPHPEGSGIKRSLRDALKDSGSQLNEIDYILAHGTGTVSNDKHEAVAFNELFNGDPPPVTSAKSMIGHAMGAASVIEAIIAMLSLNHQMITPTINYETPDPECPVTIVANKALAKSLHTCLTNSSGFGGNNSTMIFSLIEEKGERHD